MAHQALVGDTEFRRTLLGAASLLALSSQREGLAGQAPEPGLGAGGQSGVCSGREEAGLGHLVGSCPPRRAARRPRGCSLAQGLPCRSASQPSPAPQELSEQPARPPSPLGGLPGGRAQEAPTASQGLLRLFQRNTPVEDLGAKGVSPDGEPRRRAGPAGGWGGICGPRATLRSAGDTLPDRCHSADHGLPTAHGAQGR